MGDRYVTMGKPDDREAYSPREFGGSLRTCSCSGAACAPIGCAWVCDRSRRRYGPHNTPWVRAAFPPTATLPLPPAPPSSAGGYRPQYDTNRTIYVGQLRYGERVHAAVSLASSKVKQLGSSLFGCRPLAFPRPAPPPATDTDERTVRKWFEVYGPVGSVKVGRAGLPAACWPSVQRQEVNNSRRCPLPAPSHSLLLSLRSPLPPLESS